MGRAAALTAVLLGGALLDVGRAGGPDRVSLMSTTFAVENGGPKVYVNTEITFEVPEGSQQSRFYKSISANGQDMPVTGLSVMNTDETGLAHELSVYDDGVAKVKADFPS